jgi:hypothetical protein
VIVEATFTHLGTIWASDNAVNFRTTVATSVRLRIYRILAKQFSCHVVSYFAAAHIAPLMPLLWVSSANLARDFGSSPDSFRSFAGRHQGAEAFRYGSVFSVACATDDIEMARQIIVMAATSSLLFRPTPLRPWLHRERRQDSIQNEEAQQ